MSKTRMNHTGPGRGVDYPRLGRYLESLEREAFFGSVILNFQNGVLTTLRTEQVLRLSDLPEEPGAGPRFPTPSAE